MRSGALESHGVVVVCWIIGCFGRDWMRYVCALFMFLDQRNIHESNVIFSNWLSIVYYIFIHIQ